MQKKIVLGLGNNIDYEISWDGSVIEDQIRKLGIRKADIRRPSRIDSLRSLVISILHYMQNETGGERHGENIEDLLSFSSLFPYKITLGGTSVRASIVMDKLGLNSFTHLVTDNGDVRRLLPERADSLCSSEGESVYPHLIIQYPPDAEVKANDIRIRTSRANRLIYTNDPDNELMKIHPSLGRALADSDIFLISGFNAIQSPEVLRRSLKELLDCMEELPGEAKVFYEDACFHREELNRIVRDSLRGRIAIHSMNEDELKNYTGMAFSLLNPEEVHRAVSNLQSELKVPLLMIHSRHWALISGNGALSYKKALQSGVAMATTRFRRGDDFNRDDYAETAGLPPEDDAAEFCERFNGLYAPHAVSVPSIGVKEKDVTTIGLGDAYVGGFLSALLIENI